MSERFVEVVRRQIGDVDIARVLRDDEAWAERLTLIEDDFAPDFEFVVHGPGEPVSGRGWKEYRRRFLDWIEPFDRERGRRAAGLKT